MPSASTFDFAGNAVSDIFGAVGDFQNAKGLKKAAQYADLSAQIAQQSAQIKSVQAGRQLYKFMGGQVSDIASAGLKLSGSALDVMRDSATQGALSKQLIANQGAIDVMGYKAEAASYASQASAAKSSGIGKAIGAGLSIAGMVMFSDDRLKENVTLDHRRADGLGIYHFNFKGDKTVYEGLLASDAMKVYPDAVQEKDGHLMVDYQKLRVLPKVISHG